jgi:hypothetical protein
MYDTRPMDVHLFIKYFYCANYTIHHTRARWIARLADDTLVNFAKLGQFINRLEVRYNPLTEFVLKAHCIDYGFGRLKPYPQGGAGAVLSRHACAISIEHQVSMLRELRLLEDVEIGRYLYSRRFPGIAMAGDNFMGHTPELNEMAMLSKPETMPLCSSVKVQSNTFDLFKRDRRDRSNKCGQFFTPLNEVVFVHAHPWHQLEGLLKYATAYFDAPPWVVWWNPIGGGPKFCKEENATLLDELSFWRSPKVKWGDTSWY